MFRNFETEKREVPMRSIVVSQMPLVAHVDHPLARELRLMSAIVDALPPTALAAVHADIVAAGGDPDKGREGMSADQVLRAMVIKQMTSSSYNELAFHMHDSWTFRAFCRIGMGESLSKSTLQKNIKCIKAETWEVVNHHLVAYAREQKIELGKKTRTDCTVVESNIHDPTDSSLLWDSVRVLTRLMTKAQEDFGRSFVKHTRRAHRRAIAILNAKRAEDRKSLYRDLLAVTGWVVEDARRIADELKVIASVQAYLLVFEIEHYLPLIDRVVQQTTRRVLNGESVPSCEKIVSIFEPHTDVIVKDRRDTFYGHKVCLTTGASGMVVDLVVEEGNPADSTLASRMVERVKGIFGKAPRQATFDGGFSSKANVTDIKALGVEDVAFSKHVGLEIEEMARSKWVFKKLRNFRAGIEAGISWLKRVFGLSRCTWKGHPAFKSYVWASTVAFNLLVLARHNT
jgi:transposase, IS5 family